VDKIEILQGGQFPRLTVDSVGIVDKVDRYDSVDRGDTVDGVDRVERIDKVDRVDRVDRVGRVGKFNFPEYVVVPIPQPSAFHHLGQCPT